MSDLVRHAYAMTGPQAGARLGEAGAIEMLEADACAWAHLPARDPRTRPWIEAHLAYLDAQAIGALLAEETRPRATAIGGGYLLILRGLNLNEGEDPEDLVSVRIWADPHRVVTLARKPMREIEAIAAGFEAGGGPRSTGAFLAELAERLNEGMEPFVRDLTAKADEMEEIVAGRPDPEMRAGILDLRLAAITLRRYVAPQRDALEALMRGGGALLSKGDHRRLQEVHDRLTRIIEELDAMRDRMQVLREELASQLSDRLNRNMYLLSILSAVFLPLGFLTGLFGINVAGLPGAGTDWAFWAFAAAMLAIGLGVLGFLRWKRWF